MQPTLKQIAELAGVSIGTVHRAIHKNGPVSKENMERIEAIIKELDYKPNIIARTLVKGQSLNFGIIKPFPEQDGSYWQLPEIGINEAVKDLQHFRAKGEYFYFDKFSRDSFLKAGHDGLNAKLDGLLIAPVQEEAITTFLNSIPNELPYVFFDSNIPDAPCLSSIHQDSFNAGQTAAKLMRLYHQQTGTVSVVRFFPKTYHIEQRMKGFKEYLDSHSDLNIVLTDIPPKSNRNDIHQIFNKLINSHPDLKGVFVTDAHTFEAAEYFVSTKNIENLTIMGFDLIEANVKYLKDGIIDILISQHPDLQGYMGIQSLYRILMLDKKVDREVFMPIEIITKENVHFSRSYNFHSNDKSHHLNMTYELDH